MTIDPRKPTIEWKIPKFILKSEDWDKVFIYRSFNENDEYDNIDEIDSKINDKYINSYTDMSSNASRRAFYLVKYHNTIANETSKWLTTLFDLTPKEARLVEQIRSRIDDFTKLKLSDYDVRNGLMLGLYQFNVKSPMTDFTLETLPKHLEFLIIIVGTWQTILSKYLDVAVRDYSSSDSGLSLSIDRGTKLQNAINSNMEIYNTLITQVKLNFAYMGGGVGSVSLPVGLGHNLGRNIMQVLNIFQGIA